jgi:hypothetical protein
VGFYIGKNEQIIHRLKKMIKFILEIGKGRGTVDIPFLSQIFTNLGILPIVG